MEELLERTKTSYFSVNGDVKEREHNARINENYRKIFGVESATEQKEESYVSTEALRGIGELNETFEELRRRDAAESAASLYAKQSQNQRLSTPAYSAAQEAVKSGVFSSEYLREAALKKAAENYKEAVKDEKSVQETLFNAQKAVKEAQTMSAAASDERAYYMELLKKVVVALALVFVAVMVVLSVNSVVLENMDIQILNLQGVIDSIQSNIASLRQAIVAMDPPQEVLNYIAA